VRQRTPAALVFLAMAAIAVLGTPPIATAQQAPDRAEVVIVFDFSASILQDAANRDRFATAIEQIAARVDAISADLEAGDSTVSFVQFAVRAQDYPRCVELRLLGSPETVGRFATCLRSVAAAYRRGLNPTLTRQIGVDTNYVAAMERAAVHLPADAVRPTLILFTDGKHDVAGVPVSQVLPARDRLFGDRSPFALLPVGMGLDAAERATLQQGLESLAVIRDMPACVTGATFDWPQVVFTTPADAGNAVAVALQESTCTFTVAPTPVAEATPTPTPAPVPAPVRDVLLAAGDAQVTVSWVPPATTEVEIVEYVVRCRTGEEAWQETTVPAASDNQATFTGLVNGADYECQVATAGRQGAGRFTPAPATVQPIGPPEAPPAPSVTAVDGGAIVAQSPQDGSVVSEYRYECSADGGATWTETVTSPATVSSASITGLTNGLEYVCRAFAANVSGVSEPSPVSAVIRPCGSAIECNPTLTPILAVVGTVLGIGLLAALVAVYRGRARDYVVVVVDVVHTRNLGHGRRFDVSLIRGQDGRVTDVDRTRRGPPDFRIRYLGHDRFAVLDGTGHGQEVTSGRPVIVLDARGTRHEVVFWAFATPSAAAAQAGRR